MGLRLTEKNEFFKYVLPCYNINGDNLATEISFSETDYTCKKYIVGEAIKRLGELEDILEKYKIESIEDLDSIINSIKTNTLIDMENKAMLELENANLKNKLAELKQKVVVLEKAFELACFPRDDWGGREYSGTEFDNYHDYFIAEAEKELAEIKGE